MRAQSHLLEGMTACWYVVSFAIPQHGDPGDERLSANPVGLSQNCHSRTP